MTPVQTTTHPPYNCRRVADQASPPPLILVVDDDETTLMVLHAALGAAGYRVKTRSAGLGTSARMLRERPAAVLLDVSMPGITGDALAEMVRSKQQLRGVVVVLHSSRPRDELEELARRCGADGAIPKTGSSTAVVEELGRLLEKSHHGRA